MQLAVINATEPKDYRSTAKEKSLEQENRKLKELLGKKELELDMLQDLLKKEIPESAAKVTLAKEYSKKGLKLARSCKLLQVSRTSCYPKKKTENDDKKPSGKVVRPIPRYSYGINNCIVDDSVIETLLHEACEKYPFYKI